MSSIVVGTLAATVSVVAIDTTAPKAVQAETVQEQLQKAQDDVQKMASKVNALVDKNKKLQDDISKKEKDIDALTKDIDKKQTEFKERKENYSKDLRSIQKSNDDKNNTLLSVFSGKNPFDAISKMLSTDTIVKAKQTSAKEVVELKEDLEDAKDKLNKEKEDLVKQKEQVTKDLAEEKKQKDEALSKVASLRARFADQINAQQDQANKIAENERKLGADVGAATKGKVTNSGNLLSNAAQFIGVPYVWGGTTPAGFDCSGFVSYVEGMSGVSLPRTSQAQSTVGTYVPVSQLQAGDLVFWGGVGSAYHVGIYVGNGTYIHAPTPGQSVTYQTMSYYAPSFGRRI